MVLYAIETSNGRNKQGWNVWLIICSKKINDSFMMNIFLYEFLYLSFEHLVMSKGIYFGQKPFFLNLKVGLEKFIIRTGNT